MTFKISTSSQLFYTHHLMDNVSNLYHVYETSKSTMTLKTTFKHKKSRITPNRYIQPKAKSIVISRQQNITKINVFNLKCEKYMGAEP